MNDKLKRLAKNISELLPDNPKSPQNVFDSFSNNVYESQKDYFNALGSDSIIKIILYIYSLKETGEFKMGDNMINRLSFASLFFTSGNYSQITCDSCGGDGVVECDYCNHNGLASCEECGGDGTDSDGEECGDCGGQGEVYCNNCGGDGGITCSSCDGTGEVESDEVEYNYSYICTWNNEIKNLCELNEGTQEPAMSEYDFDRLSDDYITLFYTEEAAELRNFVDTNVLYCISYLDEPKLGLQSDKLLQIRWDDSLNFQSYMS
jgi:hypothetical protein